MIFRLPDDALLPWPMRETISVSRAAKIMGCGVNIVIELIQEGQILAYKLRPHRKSCHWRVHYPSVVAYCNKIRRVNRLEEPNDGKA
jgi:hypothetical protein